MATAETELNVNLERIKEISWAYPTKYANGYGMYPVDNFTDPKPYRPENMSWEEYAKSVPIDFVAILETQTLRGIVVINGKEISVTSEEFRTGFLYINAKRYSLDEAKKLPDAPIDLIKCFEIMDTLEIVKTRAGTWEPFDEGDKIIYTSNSVS